MSFEIKKLSCFGGDTESGNPKLWKYNVPVSSEGTPDTITTAGYFDPKCGLLAGDIVLAITASLGFYVITESSGVLTAEAIPLEADSLPVATNDTFGVVKPDGTTITASDGVITAA